MSKLLQHIIDHAEKKRHLVVSSVPDGFDAIVAADLARGLATKATGKAAALVFVARDGQRQASLEAALGFVAPDIDVLSFPNWDCQPYDRVSPNSSIVSRRMTVLARLARSQSGDDRPRILIVTANGLLQRVPSKARVGSESFSAAPGNRVDTTALALWLENNGFMRQSTVRETGEYAVRGGIIDLYAPGMVGPVRLDFFGDTLESIRSFDPETQRTVGQLRALDLVPMSEIQLTTEAIKRFRQGYVAAFGAPGRDDLFYEAISEGRRPAGLEHWLPLFHDRLDTVFDYVPDVPFMLDPLVEEAALERAKQVLDHYEARRDALSQPGAAPYKPLSPGRLHLTTEELSGAFQDRSVIRLTPFAVFDSSPVPVIDAGARQGRIFAAERAASEGANKEQDAQNVFDAVVGHIAECRASNRRVLVAAWSEGARERLGHVLSDHGLSGLKPVATFEQSLTLKSNDIGLAVWGIERGFETDTLVVVGEQDILGDRLIRRARRSKRAQDVIAEAGSLTPGDLVVHVDHGIGRFVGLKTIDAAGAPHDCVELHYAGGDRLFLPVENLDLLSRYGSEDTEITLDRLGGGAWQARKAKLKQRIREMAHALIKIAAARMLKEAPKLLVSQGLYEEFSAKFPYDETEDQLSSIESVLADLSSGRPMDRLLCGDVGFGKTEVALRAAFVAALAGKQVAVVVPTTLLARQHFKTFAARFAGLPVVVRQLSRFISTADAKETKQGITDGTVDIVIGTHALLGKAIAFRDLGLLIVDEEQHFGVGHKERLKELRAEVHVLTLTATPIPRTLQLAMTGVRDLSIMATPPVDRLAVRTFVMPFDPLMIREALLRERYRGGQSFYVCPRIEDIEEVRAFLAREVPEAKVGVAHGQMPAQELESVMTAFYEGQYDILLSTAIVESGLDIPTANTLIIHRADMFGLAALYQLRGRVGRGKTRAYALFTVPANRTLTVQAEKRLKVLQSLDRLGAGFELASHDLDLRGAGNLLGDEQSGHIKEVGYELYQQMLEEAVAQLKAGITDEDEIEGHWSPSITIGTPVMIPEPYVPDLTLRMQLYKRLSSLETDSDIDAFGAELIDRFGSLPEEVRQLLSIVGIKALCLRANVEKIDAGPRGILINFRDNSFANPEGLIKYIGQYGSLAKVRPDMRIVFIDDYEKPSQRLIASQALLRDLVRIAEEKKPK
jgi:transcription-repair coupling factor (superfamily II helicase)